MKKLLFWAVLLMTGFAFYSCDERFDNPVAERQDPSNPASSWTYEVGIKFAQFTSGYADVDGENYTYKAPSTVFVYNKAGEKLGELKALEEFDYDNFNWNSYYKFSGTLKGAIGEDLVISTLDGFDYYSKQDGTLKSIMENGVLETAEVPIIVTNATKGTIGTQNATLENKIFAMRLRFYNGSYYNVETDNKGFTFKSDSLIIGPTTIDGKAIDIELAKDLNTTKPFFFAFAPASKESHNFIYEIESENGYISYGRRDNIFKAQNSVSGTWGFDFYCKQIDLTKYYTYRKSINENLETLNLYLTSYTDDNIMITQSGADPVKVRLEINAKNLTFKDLNLETEGYSASQISSYSDPDPGWDRIPTITLEGKNSFKTDVWEGLIINGFVTLQGEGTLSVTGKNYGVNIYGSWPFYDENWQWYQYPAKLVIKDNVKLISSGIVISEGVDADNTSSLELNGGSIESEGTEGNAAIWLNNGGILNIGTGATSVKATTGQEGEDAICILDGVTGKEAAEFDKTKFNDSIKDGVRTISPKK